MKSVYLSPIAAVLLATSMNAASQEGMFARFKTSVGEFRAKLEHEKTPLTVANFVGLIEGSQAYVDVESGQVKRGNYYDGIIFHRVISNFMIQGGSPAGTGSDGPGYRFGDEFDSSLRHDGPYVLSMANSGPATNGSQFFVTVRATPHLDDLHSVFGRVVEGSDVVQAISEVETAAGDRPVEDVVIESLRIEREGEAAQAFNVESQGLPVVRSGNLRFSAENGSPRLTLSAGQGQVLSVVESTDLRTWTPSVLSGLGYQEGEKTHAWPVGSDDVSQRYYLASVVQYPEPYHVPVEIVSKVFTANLDSGQTIVYRFDEELKGQAKLDENPEGSIVAASYIPDTNIQATLTVQASSVAPLRFSLLFDSPSSGSFSARILTSGGTVRGTFHLMDP